MALQPRTDSDRLDELLDELRAERVAVDLQTKILRTISRRLRDTMALLVIMAVIFLVLYSVSWLAG